MSDFNIPPMQSTLSRVDIVDVQSQSEHDDKSQISNNAGALKKQAQDKSMDAKDGKQYGGQEQKKKKSRFSFLSKSSDKGKKKKSMVIEDAIVRKQGKTPGKQDGSKGSTLKPPLPNQP